MDEAELIEALAEYAHTAWSGWMEYMFSKGCYNTDDSFTIPASLAQRWERQLSTPYSNLTYQEKISDREEAKKILSILKSSANDKPMSHLEDLERSQTDTT
jgi:hypothetical protein